MTNVKKLLILLSDGKRRTRARIAEEMGLTVEEAERVIRTAMAAKNIASAAPAVVYRITEPGKAQAVREPVKPELLVRKRSERYRRQNSKPTAVRVRNDLMTHRATSGAIPNSVFALGAHA